MTNLSKDRKLVQKYREGAETFHRGQGSRVKKTKEEDNIVEKEGQKLSSFTNVYSSSLNIPPRNKVEMVYE